MCQRLFFKRIAHNRDYIQTHCNDRRNPFHFACRQWYNYTYSNTNNSIFIRILVRMILIFLLLLQILFC